MATEYLETKKANDRQTRTLVRTCHNYKNIVLVNETFNENTRLWRSDNSFIIPVNYIKPIVEYTKQHDVFQLTRTPEKSAAVSGYPYSPRYYGCITPIKTKNGRGCEKIFKENQKIVRGL